MYAGWNKLEDFIGIDRRSGIFSHPPTKNMWGFLEIKIHPTIQADMRFLPIQNSCADLIIFDPPHVKSSRKESWLGRAYGMWSDAEKSQTLKAVNQEFVRVLRDKGFILVKILSNQITLYKQLLSNFEFFLPIYTLRRRGMFAKKQIGAMWMLGKKKVKAERESPYHQSSADLPSITA